MRVGNRGPGAHFYEHRATREIFVIPVGEVREVPDEVGRLLVRVHPQKLYDADAPASEEPKPEVPEVSNRMLDTNPRRGRRRRLAD